MFCLLVPASYPNGVEMIQRVSSVALLAHAEIIEQL